MAAAIRAITESAQKVKTLVDEVKLGSEEQARGIEQIAKAITQMEQVTQRAAANAEESASAGAEMSSQAQTLHTAVAELTAVIGRSEDGGGVARFASVTKRKTEDVGNAAAPAANLRALAGAVQGERRVPETQAFSLAGRGARAIPLDDDFKEF